MAHLALASDLADLGAISLIDRRGLTDKWPRLEERHGANWKEIACFSKMTRMMKATSLGSYKGLLYDKC